MSWNYRTLKHKDPDGTLVFGIHEVYYREDGSVESWTENPVAPIGETVKELQGVVFTQYQRALMLPVIDVTVDPLVELTVLGMPRQLRQRQRTKR